MSKIEVEDLTITDLPQPERPAIAGVTPAVIDTGDGVTISGVDRMDSVDRKSLPVEAKLILLCEETRALTGRDPRGGGHALVARPRVILQMLLDSKITPMGGLIRLQRAVVIGTSRGRRDESTVGESDIVGWWCDIPVALRSACASDKLFCLPLEQIPRSLPIDRQQAGRLRIAAHHGLLAIDNLRDDPPEGRPS